MDTALQSFLTWQFLAFCLAISAIVLVLRTVVEYLFNVKGKVAKDYRLWTDLILPILPVLVGISCSLTIKQYPYSEGLSSFGGRFIFGLTSGLLAGFVWRIAKSFLVSKISEQNTENLSGGAVDKSKNPDNI